MQNYGGQKEYSIYSRKSAYKKFIYPWISLFDSILSVTYFHFCSMQYTKKMDWPESSAAEISWTISWKELELVAEKVGEAGIGAGKVKLESEDEASELLEVNSICSSPSTGPEVEVCLDEVDKIIFSSETWLDMEYIILRHTKLDLVLVKWLMRGFTSCHNFKMIVTSIECKYLNNFQHRFAIIPCSFPYAPNPLSLFNFYLFILLLVSSAFFLVFSQIFFPFWPSFQVSFYKSR